MFAMLFVTAACGPERKEIPKLDQIGAGGIGAGGTPADAGAEAAAACFQGAHNFRATAAAGGTYAVEGTVALPKAVPSGLGVLISVQPCASAMPQNFAFVTTTETSESFTYVIYGLEAGCLFLRAQVDIGRSDTFGDRGDYDGYYPGSLTGPIFDKAEATTVQVNACMPGIGFGIGARP
jgi:hypothetical protein